MIFSIWIICEIALAISSRRTVMLTMLFFVAGSVCLTFAYHMYGIDMGVLEVAFGNVTYFYEAGDKGNQWRKARITLREFTNYPMNDKVATLFKTFTVW